MNQLVAESPWIVDPDLLRRFDLPGPRYTSYPTADRFADGFDPETLRTAMRERIGGDRVGGATPLSVYVHVPFCESVCYYCACNKVVTRHHARAQPYLACLEAELALVLRDIGPGQPVGQLHFGGGSPTFLSDDEIERLMTTLRRSFQLQPDAEVSIEVDPRTVTPARLAALWRSGFNRLSFGVQDFDPAVQQAIHRIQPFEGVRELMHAARDIGFESLNADLIYGLPRQTPESMARTLAQAASLRPDRIALYAYAHLPQRFAPQRRIHPHELPDAESRLRMLSSAIATFIAHGYSHIGMDHFALPTDPLAVAKRQGRMHRNFQGYSTHADADLVALGVSAIGRMGAVYSQNERSLPAYMQAVSEGRLPVARGLRASRDDLTRRAIIMALMCQGRVDFESIEVSHMVDMNESFRPELERLRPFRDAGLIEIEPGAISLTPQGWYVVRAMAMVFDRYLPPQQDRVRFSRII